MRSAEQFEIFNLVCSTQSNRNNVLNLRMIARVAAPAGFAVKFTSIASFAPDKIFG